MESGNQVPYNTKCRLLKVDFDSGLHIIDYQRNEQRGRTIFVAIYDQAAQLTMHREVPRLI